MSHSQAGNNVLDYALPSRWCGFSASLPRVLVILIACLALFFCDQNLERKGNVVQMVMFRLDGEN
jgi:hypothetical protein